MKEKLTKNRIQKMEEVNDTMVDHLLDVMQFYNCNDKECIELPDSKTMRIKKPNSAEDFTHGAFDFRDFQIIYTSKKYKMEERTMSAMTNTLIEAVHDKNKGFAAYLDGRGKHRMNYSLISYIWYTSFNPKINTIIINHLLENDIVSKNHRLDSSFIFEILKLKEKHYKIYNSKL
jgi:hypothetical protein